MTYLGEQGALPDLNSVVEETNGSDKTDLGNHPEGGFIQKINPIVGPHIKCTLVIKIGD